jgi:hypothetical protein
MIVDGEDCAMDKCSMIGCELPASVWVGEYFAREPFCDKHYEELKVAQRRGVEALFQALWGNR